MEKVHYLQPKTCVKLLSEKDSLYRIEATLSPYAGCSSRCIFCPFANAGRIGVKTDFLHLLEKQITALPRRLALGLGTACEPYCPEEEEYALTRNTLEVIAQHSLPLHIFTKSALVLRDRAFLSAYSQRGLLTVSLSLCTLDEGLVQLFEPGTISPGARLEVVRDLRGGDVLAGVVLSPIIPYITDAEEQLERIFAAVKKAGAEYILPSVLWLKGEQRKKVLRFIKEHFPSLYHRVENIYGSDPLPSVTYTARINDILAQLSGKYRLPLSLPTRADEGPGPGIRKRLLI